MKKLNIYLYGDNSGVGWYRIHSPARQLKKQGLANIMTSEWRWTQESEKIKFPSIEQLTEIGHWADLIVMQRHDQLQYIATFCGIGELFNLPVILDTDDNIEGVRPHNPGYQGYHPGSEATAWGKKVVEKVDAITVSTDNLKEIHEKDKSTYVLPNSLDIEFREKVKRPKPDGKIHIGWLGSAAHLENLQFIDEVIVEILKKHENVVFHCMAMYMNCFLDNLPKDLAKRVVRHDWWTFKNWPKGLASLGLDIGLAPACDNLFNRAKSNLRWLEYSMNETATIASNVPAYKEIENNVTGILVQEKHEWFDAIDDLIENEEKRKKIGKNAKKTVIKQFSVEKNAKNWLKVYKQVVADFKENKGDKRYYNS